MGQGAWEQIGPQGGFFKDFAFDPHQKGVVYAGSDDGGGVWKSTNGGKDWSLLTTGFPNFTGWHIEPDPNVPGRVYAAELYGRYGLLRSDDSGDTWKMATNGLDTYRRKQVSKVAIASVTSDTLFISTGEGAGPNNASRPGDGVFKSTDGGANWQPSGFQGLAVACIEHTGGLLFAGVHGQGLWASGDFGENWINHPDIPDTADVHQIEAIDSVVVASATEGVFLSLDYGISFENIGLPGSLNLDVGILSMPPNLKVLGMPVAGPAIFDYASRKWQPIASPLLEGQLGIGLGIKGGSVYLGRFNSGLMVKSDDGGLNWRLLANSPLATEVPSIVALAEGDTLFASLQHSYHTDGKYNVNALSRSVNQGKTWQPVGPVAHGLDLVESPSQPGTLWLATFAQGMFKSSDGFESWQQVRKNGQLVLDIEAHPVLPNTVLSAEINLKTGEAGIFKTTNGGNSWAQKAQFSANQLAIVPLTDTVYAATDQGLLLSDDGGDNWSMNPAYLDKTKLLSVVAQATHTFVGTSDGRLFKIASAVI